jgi:hypothetical protein
VNNVLLGIVGFEVSSKSIVLYKSISFISIISGSNISAKSSTVFSDSETTSKVTSFAVSKTGLKVKTSSLSFIGRM